MRRIMVILNPRAGRGNASRRRAELERLLEEAVTKCATPSAWTIVQTAHVGHATELAKQAAETGADMVAAAGGDGTLNEVVNGLAESGAVLGLLPMGTGNDFGRCLGIGTFLWHAVDTLVEGVARPVDLGKANGRWFVNIAGCGFDAIVAQRVNIGFPLLRGTTAYLAAIAHSLLTLKAADLTLTIDGETMSVRALMCSVANATSYGGGLKVAPDAEIDDGLFDICLLREAGRMEFILAFPRVFKGTHITHPRVTMLRGKSIHIASDRPLPLLIDGEVIGTTPVEFSLVHHAIQVMSPRTVE